MQRKCKLFYDITWPTLFCLQQLIVRLLCCVQVIIMKHGLCCHDELCPYRNCWSKGWNRNLGIPVSDVKRTLGVFYNLQNISLSLSIALVALTVVLMKQVLKYLALNVMLCYARLAWAQPGSYYIVLKTFYILYSTIYETFFSWRVRAKVGCI